MPEETYAETKTTHEGLSLPLRLSTCKMKCFRENLEAECGDQCSVSSHTNVRWS